MRTTLMIHDELYKEVKRVAAGRQASVSQVVNDALRRELVASAVGTERQRVSIPAYGKAGMNATDTSPAEFDALLQQEGEWR